MLSLLGTIFGLLGSLFPQILKMWQSKYDYAHEEKMFDLGMQAAASEHKYKLEEMNVQADISETEALYKAAAPIVTGSKILDGIVNLYSSSVRPTVTYAFLALYGYVKLSMIYAAIQGGFDWKLVGTMVWGSEDFAVFSTIMAFWFGGRFMKTAMDRMSHKIPMALDIPPTVTPKIPDALLTR